MFSVEDNDSNISTADIEKEKAMEAGYAALAADPEFQQEQTRRKAMRGLIQRRNTAKTDWQES